MPVDFNEIRELIAFVTLTDASELSADSSMSEWDSFTFWEIIGAVEDKWGVHFSIAEGTKIKKLGDIYESLSEKI